MFEKIKKKLYTLFLPLVFRPAAILPYLCLLASVSTSTASDVNCKFVARVSV